MLPQALLLCLLLVASVGPERPAASSVQLPEFAYTAARNYAPLAWLHGEDRFSSDAAVFVRDGKESRKLIPGFASSADPAVSFDGQKILFAGKAQPNDPWQIWEINADGSEPRRVTSNAEDCVRPFYLPEDRIVYARKIARRFVIETADLTGRSTLALTYGPANFMPTDVLRDGRILFEAGYPLGTESIPEMYTVYSDGSGVESYRCDHGNARHSGRQSNSGDIVFASAHGLARFTSARAQEIQMLAPAGEYAGDVAETAEGMLISWRPNFKSPFRLIRWTPGSANLDFVMSEPTGNIVQPALIVSHATPNRHPSGLHDWPNANLLCLNAYTSKYLFAPGSIRTARLYTRDAGGNPKLLGSASVEADGSFFVHVPTEQPLQIELLDASGRTLKRESGFFWMRRGEQRVCVGCHAGPETAPENAVPMTLLKSTTPADMNGADAQSPSGGH